MSHDRADQACQGKRERAPLVEGARQGVASVVWPHRLQHPHPHHRASVHPGSFHCPLQTSSGAVIKTTLHEPIRSESSACITSLPRACEQSRTSCGEAGTQVPPSLNLQPWPLQEWERQALPPQENGSPLQYSGLGNPMDRGAWWATAHGVAKSRTQLSDGVFPSSGKFSVLHGLESNPGSSLQTEEEAGLP